VNKKNCTELFFSSGDIIDKQQQKRHNLFFVCVCVYILLKNKFGFYLISSFCLNCVDTQIYTRTLPRTRVDGTHNAILAK
jgi:hypothetical protein